MKVILINGSQHAKGRCMKEDIVNSTADKLAQADGMIFASPVYFASINGTFSAFPDRLYASGSYRKDSGAQHGLDGQGHAGSGSKRRAAPEGLNERNAIFR